MAFIVRRKGAQLTERDLLVDHDGNAFPIKRIRDINAMSRAIFMESGQEFFIRATDTFEVQLDPL